MAHQNNLYELLMHMNEIIWEERLDIAAARLVGLDLSRPPRLSQNAQDWRSLSDPRVVYYWYITVDQQKGVTMFTKIGTITIGVSDQDKALDFYVNKLGFEKVDDQPMSETERWLEIALPGTQTHIMLGLRGQSGNNNTGMTGFVLHTDNIEETCATLKARGVT
ncbi:MAG: VOC family protein, partial [Ktedonobacteraceae bacterium]